MEKYDFTVDKLGEATINSPLEKTNFEKDDASVVYETDVNKIIEYYKKHDEILSFKKAGPREKIFHDPKWTKAAVLTAGGLCPGLNDVIKGITLTLKNRYAVPVVYGIRYGFKGLIPSFGFEPMLLSEQTVDDIHESGGSILGSSRGQQDEKIMCETLVRRNINILFCIGGDGTLRCAHDLAAEIKKRKLSISVVCIPKTIDNDINFIDKTFGFETAVYATNDIITAAHNEAHGAYNGLGLIHVMGRDSGFIAAYASVANSHVNYCLIPEEAFSLTGGDNAVFESIVRRLEVRKHAVLIVAEGAGQELFKKEKQLKDKSGNCLKQDIGLFLKNKFAELAKERGIELNIKYFDPSYLIRSLPAHGTDAVFCLMLGQNAVHAAMSGFTDIVIGHWNDAFNYVPIAMATSERKKIDINGPLWRSVRGFTWNEK